MVRKMKIKVEPKTVGSWVSIFRDWSEMMKDLYGQDVDIMFGGGAPDWADNPADWMTPYNDTVFYSWIDWESGDPFSEWEKDMKKAKLIK